MSPTLNKITILLQIPAGCGSPNWKEISLWWAIFRMLTKMNMISITSSRNRIRMKWWTRVRHIIALPILITTTKFKGAQTRSQNTKITKTKNRPRTASLRCRNMRIRNTRWVIPNLILTSKIFNGWRSRGFWSRKFWIRASIKTSSPSLCRIESKVTRLTMLWISTSGHLKNSTPPSELSRK